MGTFGSAVVRMLSGLVSEARLLPYRGDWVPPEHVDRLRQYEIFRALHENRFGALLKSKEAAKKLRGYGDYALIVETSRDALLGDRIDIEVPGAADEANAAAVARKKLLDGWAERERWASKLYRCETDAAAVGDCVYELRADGSRLRLRAHDPEVFLPVWENAEGEFNDAYLAWEEPNTGQYLAGDVANLRDLRSRDGEIVLYRRHYETMTMQEAIAAGVEVVGARDRELVCVVTAAWFRIEEGRGEQPQGWRRLQQLGFELDDDGEPIERIDTGFDTPPLFYVPNREATGQPWGLPEGDVVLQTLLDAAQDQTDLKENTFHNAFPVMYDENPPVGALPRPGQPGQPATKSEEKYKPGVIYNGRKLGAVDMSKGNELLLGHEKFLIDKALSNSRTTMIAAGKMEVGDIPSGIALLIAMLPLFAKTLPKRQTRKDKLGMMLKHVIRWHREFGNAADFFGADDEREQNRDAAWPAGIFDDETAYPSFGSILPIDKKQVSEIVTALLSANAISDETAVTMLVDAGFPIDDAKEEVARLAEARQPPAGEPGSRLGGEGIRIPGIDAA